ncbi:MAG: DUF899 domain-containing protein [Thermoleophilaceae bacterium]|nr:DUF899 domain-containing protein [Thermoleophilaceae bacterium]
MSLPPVVSRAEWQAAHEDLLAKEKQATRARDALAAERRRQPMVRVDKDYVFKGPDGEANLLDLFDGRRQLIVYKFMLEPGGDPCVGCSGVADNLPHLAYMRDRNTNLVFASRAPVGDIEAVKERLGWDMPWFTYGENDFNEDFVDGSGGFGLNVFLRDGDEAYRTYYTHGRGVEALGATVTYLDITPYGRQEEWEDSPEGWPQEPTYSRGALHDEYATA